MVDLSKYAAGTKKFMSKALWDPQQGEDLTIARIEEQLFTDRDGRTKNKLVCHWVEDRPPLVMNVTHRNWLLGTYGPRDEHWAGKRVHVFHDPTVEFPRGTKVGGVGMDLPGSEPPAKPGRLSRAEALKAELNKQQQETQPHGDLDDDIPF